MLLELHAPPARRAELAWIAGVLLERWLGLPCVVVPSAGIEIELHLPGGGVVVWPDLFLGGREGRWLAAGSVPVKPAVHWEIPDPDLARRTGQRSLASWFVEGPFELGERRIRLPIDITGSAFFVLSRYEEAVCGAERDRHGRPMGRASVAQRDALALRPLVDEWVELLWWAIARLAPSLERRQRRASTWISCDVDAPFSPFGKGAKAWLRQAAGLLAGERRLRPAAATLLSAALAPFGVSRHDPFDTFEWMLDANERAGHRMSFFFLALEKPARIDGLHAIDEPPVAALLERIVRRGHEVGLHGSYASVDEPTRLADELQRLRQALSRAGGDGLQLPARQHYLRWRPDDTPRRLAELGVSYDSTLCFADIAGFRCGTSHSFPMFDLTRGEQLTLIERPLVLMETTVLSRSYLGLADAEAAHSLMHGLRASCHRFDGEFSLLWHNSRFFDQADRELYLSLLAQP